MASYGEHGSYTAEKEGEMNALGVRARETIAMKDTMGTSPPKRKFCCTKMEFIIAKIKQKICPFCNKKI
jgi:hypothetical protein